MQSFGNTHHFFLHFPIALFIVAGIAELIYLATKNPNYQFTVKFLLIMGAIFLIPTILSGLALEEVGIITEANSRIFWWHKVFAFAALALSVITILTGIFSSQRGIYYLSLVLLILSVIATVYFGYLLVFNQPAWLPSVFPG